MPPRVDTPAAATRSTAVRTQGAAAFHASTRGIAASIAVALVVLALVVWGLLWAWHRIKRYRLAVGSAGLTVGFGIIRFISLHEAEAKRVADPALSVTPGSGKTFRDPLADGEPCPMCPEMVVAPAGTFTMGSPVAIARLCQLRNFCGLATSDPTGGDRLQMFQTAPAAFLRPWRGGLAALIDGMTERASRGAADRDQHRATAKAAGEGGLRHDRHFPCPATQHSG